MFLQVDRKAETSLAQFAFVGTAISENKFKINFNKALASGGSIVVEHSPYYPKVEGSSAATAVNTGGEKKW